MLDTVGREPRTLDDRMYDLTKEFKAVAWTGRLKQDRDLFKDNNLLCRLEKGLYVHLLYNSSQASVHDRNGKGKCLIHPSGSTIKVGKFENGIIRRRSQDADHFHESPVPGVANGNEGVAAPAAPGTFARCLRLALVLDLSKQEIVQVRSAEKMLKHELRNFIADQKLAVQDHRGDYRLLLEPGSADLSARLEKWARASFTAIVAKL